MFLDIPRKKIAVDVFKLIYLPCTTFLKIFNHIFCLKLLTNSVRFQNKSSARASLGRCSFDLSAKEVTTVVVTLWGLSFPISYPLEAG